MCVCVCGTYSGLVGELLYVCVRQFTWHAFTPVLPYSPRAHVAEPEDTDKDIDEVRNSSY